MANINQLFPSKYMKAIDVKEKELTGIIKDVTVEAIGQEGNEAPVVSFENTPKQFVLNKTNAMMVADIYGEDTDDWKGQPIELFCDRVSFRGKMCDAIRVRKPAKGKKVTLEEDEINF